MDTGLTTDTLSGVQPTLIGQYMMDTSQVPTNANCQYGNDANGFRLQQPGYHCHVRYKKQNEVDTESKLFGLDRLITKQEPPNNMIPQNSTPEALNMITDSTVSGFSPFEAITSRTKRSCNVLSEVNIDRFENPFVSPQELQHIVVNEPYRGGFQSRMSSKDCHVVNCGNELKLSPNYGTRCFKQ